MADIILACAGALRGVVRELMGLPLIHKAVSRISAEILHQMSHQADTLQVQSPVLEIIGCLDIFSAENIGKSK